MIRIVTDSSADISQSEAQQLGITVMPLTINFGMLSYLDGVDIMPNEFYDRLVNGNVHPTTSQASPLQYEELFEQSRKVGDTIILLPISRKISGSHNCAQMIKQQGGYDNVYIVDTLCTVSALRVLVLDALANKDNMSPQELVDRLHQLRNRVKLVAVIDTLEYLHKGGRVSRASATIGNMLSVKPIISIVGGEIKVVHKAMGVKKALTYLTAELANAKLDQQYPVIYGYAGTNERAIELVNKCCDENTRQGVIDNMINLSPVVGVHIGTNVAYYVYVEQI